MCHLPLSVRSSSGPVVLLSHWSALMRGRSQRLVVEEEEQEEVPDWSDDSIHDTWYNRKWPLDFVYRSVSASKFLYCSMYSLWLKVWHSSPSSKMGFCLSWNSFVLMFYYLASVIYKMLVALCHCVWSYLIRRWEAAPGQCLWWRGQRQQAQRTLLAHRQFWRQTVVAVFVTWRVITWSLRKLCLWEGSGGVVGGGREG